MDKTMPHWFRFVDGSFRSGTVAFSEDEYQGSIGIPVNFRTWFGFVVQPGTCFVSGHDFSRAAKSPQMKKGFSPCGPFDPLSLRF